MIAFSGCAPLGPPLKSRQHAGLSSFTDIDYYLPSFSIIFRARFGKDFDIT